MPRVSRSRVIAADPERSGGWSRIRTACRAGGRGRPGSRTCAATATRPSGRACSRPSAARVSGPTFAAPRPTPVSATRGSSRSRARRSSASCGRRELEMRLRARRRGHRGDPDDGGGAARALAARLADDARRRPQPSRRGARRHRAAAGRMNPADRDPGDHGGPQAKWWGWGDPQKRTPLSDGGLAMLRAELGEAEPSRRGRARRGRAARRRARAARRRSRGGRRRAGVLTAHEQRVRRAAGSSYPDLLRLRSRRRSAPRPTRS